MAGGISKLFGLDEPEERKGIFFFFTSSRTSDLGDRVDYSKVWVNYKTIYSYDENDHKGENGDYAYSSHSNVLGVVQDGILPMCIGLVMAYMVYILVSFMSQQTTNEELQQTEKDEKLLFVPNYRFEDSAIPDKIRNMYEPIKTDLSKDTSLDTTSHPDSTIQSSDLGIHTESVLNNFVTPVHNI